MNIQQLEYIIAVDRYKNFTKAAEYCYVTQATLSAMVKKLEEELDLVIFDRKSQPIITTEIGVEIIEEAKKILIHTQLIVEKAKGDKKSISGVLKLGIIPTIANSLLPMILKKMLAAFPDLLLEIEEVTTKNIIKRLQDGTLDAGIISTPIESELEEEILYYECLMVYGDIAKDKQFVVTTEIQNEKVWLLEEGHCLRDQFIELCRLQKKKSIPQNFTFEANSFETLLNMVDEFGGLTLIPELYYKLLPENRKKSVATFNTPIPVREVSMVYYRPYAKMRTIQALSNFIKAEIKPKLISQSYHNKDLLIAKM